MAINDCARVQAIDSSIQLLDEVMRLIQLPAFREGCSGDSPLVSEPVQAQLQAFLSDRSVFARPSAKAMPGSTGPGGARVSHTVTNYLDMLEEERRSWLWVKRESFHTNFGSEFTTGTRPTLFASLVMVRATSRMETSL
jgi:hypothetical protein